MVGAGHGPFTEHLIGSGASVVVIEMSAPSVDMLRQRFAGDDRVSVVHDPTGDVPVEGEFDAVVYVSVLHHIPDYLSAITRTVERIRPGGVFVSMQDPMLFARQARSTRLATRGMFFGWRITQGDFRRGLATRLRRLRGVYEESEPSDMTEYHAVRGGVDEQALANRLRERFTDVHILPYWSSQAGWAQTLGRRICAPNTFGLVANGRIQSVADRPG
jgi:SAM-dependent methyltransferase